MRTTVAAGRLVEVHRTTITKRHLMRLAAQVTADNPIVSDISNGRVKLLNQYGLEGECITDFGGRASGGWLCCALDETPDGAICEV